MKVFETKEQATKYAASEYGQTQLDTECVNVIKVGPMMAKFLGCEVGYVIDKEMN